MPGIYNTESTEKKNKINIKRQRLYSLTSCHNGIQRPWSPFSFFPPSLYFCPHSQLIVELYSSSSTHCSANQSHCGGAKTGKCQKPPVY